MKRYSYWYLYQLRGSDSRNRFEAIVYGTKPQVSFYYLRDVSLSICRCSKAVAQSLSCDIGIPIFDISNLEIEK